MANEKLRIDIEAQDRASGTINNVNKAMGKAAGSSRRTGQAFTQLAYALDDAQYGFRGVQNNIQALAVSMGASGPLILGITAATVAIGYLIDKTDLFGSSTEKAKKKISELEEQFKSLRDQIDGPPPLSETLGKTTDALIAEKKAEIADLKSLVTIGGFNTSVTTTKGSEQQIKFAELELSILEEQVRQYKEKQKAAEDYKKKLEEIARTSDIQELVIEPPAIDDSKFIEAFNKTFDSSGTVVGTDRTGIASLYDTISEASDELDILEEINALADLEDALIQVGSSFAGLSFDEAVAQMEKLKEAEQASIENSQMWSDALIGAFNSAASQGGNFLENLAKGVLSSIGTLLIQKGTAAIFSGIADNALIPGSGIPAIKQGALVVGAGVALKAGANIGGRSGSVSSGGGSSNTGRQVTYNNPNATPTLGQGNQSGDRFIGQLELRGQNLVVGLQAANETRTRF